jgi:hypothetical protein
MTETAIPDRSERRAGFVESRGRVRVRVGSLVVPFECMSPMGQMTMHKPIVSDCSFDAVFKGHYSSPQIDRANYAVIAPKCIGND